MDGTGEQHFKQSLSGSEGQKSRFPSYADYRPKTNAVILVNMGHTLRGDLSMGGIGKRKETKNLKVFDVHCRGANKVILNWQKPLWEGD
jgi:hypothetical protein